MLTIPQPHVCVCAFIRLLEEKLAAEKWPDQTRSPYCSTFLSDPTSHPFYLCTPLPLLFCEFAEMLLAASHHGISEISAYTNQKHPKHCTGLKTAELFFEPIMCHPSQGRGKQQPANWPDEWVPLHGTIVLSRAKDTWPPG